MRIGAACSIPLLKISTNCNSMGSMAGHSSRITPMRPSRVGVLNAISPVLGAMSPVLSIIGDVLGIVAEALGKVVGWLADGAGKVVSFFTGKGGRDCYRFNIRSQIRDFYRVWDNWKSNRVDTWCFWLWWFGEVDVDVWRTLLSVFGELAQTILPPVASIIASQNF